MCMHAYTPPPAKPPRPPSLDSTVILASERFPASADIMLKSRFVTICIST